MDLAKYLNGCFLSCCNGEDNGSGVCLLGLGDCGFDPRPVGVSELKESSCDLNLNNGPVFTVSFFTHRLPTVITTGFLLNKLSPQKIRYPELGHNPAG